MMLRYDVRSKQRRGETAGPSDVVLAAMMNGSVGKMAWTEPCGRQTGKERTPKFF